MLMAVTLIGHNLVSLHAWHTIRGQPEPWQVHRGVSEKMHQFAEVIPDQDAVVIADPA